MEKQRFELSPPEPKTLDDTPLSDVHIAYHPQDKQSVLLTTLQRPAPDDMHRMLFLSYIRRTNGTYVIDMRCIVQQQVHPLDDWTGAEDYRVEFYLATIPRPEYPLEIRRKWLLNRIKHSRDYNELIEVYPHDVRTIDLTLEQAVEPILAETFFALR